MSKKSTCNLKAHLHWDHFFTQDWQKRAKQMNIVNMTNMMNSAECGAYNKCNWICSTLVTSKCCLHFLWVFQSSLWLNSRKEPAMASNLAVGATKKQDVVGGNNDPEMDSKKKVRTYVYIIIYLYLFISLYHGVWPAHIDRKPDKDMLQLSENVWRDQLNEVCKIRAFWNMSSLRRLHLFTSCAGERQHEIPARERRRDIISKASVPLSLQRSITKYHLCTCDGNRLCVYHSQSIITNTCTETHDSWRIKM